MNKIIQGDSLILLAKATPNSIDAIVTDPPYGLSFMGKKWDYDVPSKEVWEQALRVLKPGGYLLSFAGTRTQHRMAVNIEDAGFEIRDMIAWVYGSGFPKSLNIGKAVDKLQGNKRELVVRTRIDGKGTGYADSTFATSPNLKRSDTPISEQAKQWEGWGTALKPALEPITVARKPLSEKTVAENVLKWGTGGINIDGSRVGKVEGDRTEYGRGHDLPHANTTNSLGKFNKVTAYEPQPQGRFPANLIHDGSDEVVSLFPDTKVGARKAGQLRHTKEGDLNFTGDTYTVNDYPANEGNASRFFYCAKASKADRNEGLENLEPKFRAGLAGADRDTEEPLDDVSERFSPKPQQNNHPTVKPTKLMQYLVKLVTPKGGVVLDPFMGSGSTGKACKLEGFDFIGIELDPEYCKIAEARINAVVQPIL